MSDKDKSTVIFKCINSIIPIWWLLLLVLNMATNVDNAGSYIYLLVMTLLCSMIINWNLPAFRCKVTGMKAEWMTSGERKIYYLSIAIAFLVVIFCYDSDIFYQYCVVPVLSAAASFVARRAYLRNAPADIDFDTIVEEYVRLNDADSYVCIGKFEDEKSAVAFQKELEANNIVSKIYGLNKPDYISREVISIQVLVLAKDKDAAEILLKSSQYKDNCLSQQ